MRAPSQYAKESVAIIASNHMAISEIHFSITTDVVIENMDDDVGTGRGSNQPMAVTNEISLRRRREDRKRRIVVSHDKTGGVATYKMERS